MMQHPVHYLCDVCDFVMDEAREYLINEDRKMIPVHEVVGLLNGIGRFIIAKENEALEEGGTNDKE